MTILLIKNILIFQYILYEYLGMILLCWKYYVHMSGIGGVGEEQDKAGDEKTGVTGLGRIGKD